MKTGGSTIESVDGSNSHEIYVAVSCKLLDLTGQCCVVCSDCLLLVSLWRLFRYREMWCVELPRAESGSWPEGR